jgi:teichuronic acid biosynthesis protein TuaE
MRIKLLKRLKLNDLLVGALIITSFFGSLSIDNGGIGQLTFVRLTLFVNLLYHGIHSFTSEHFRTPLNIYCFPFIFLPLFGFCSLLWNAAPLPVAFGYLLNLTTGCLIAILIFQYVKDEITLNRVWKFFAAGSVIQIFISIYEVISGWHVPGSKYLDPDIPSYVVELNRYAPTGFSGNPNNLAFVIGLFFCILLSWKTHTLIRYFGIIISLLLIFLTGSRLVLLTSIFVHIYFLMSSWKGRIRFKNWIKPISIFIPLLLSAFCFLSLFPDQVNLTSLSLNQNTESHVEQSANIFAGFDEISDEDNHSSGGKRKDLIFLALDSLSKRYFMGAGVGGSISLMRNSSSSDIWIANIHLFWLELLVDFGVLPFILVLTWILWLFYTNYTFYRRTLRVGFRNHISSSHIILIYIPVAGITASTLVTTWPFYSVLGIISSTVYVSIKHQLHAKLHIRSKHSSI